MFERKDYQRPVFGFHQHTKGFVVRCYTTSPLQRLNRIKQLGCPHVVYPGAQHNGSQHSWEPSPDE